MDQFRSIDDYVVIENDNKEWFENGIKAYLKDGFILAGAPLIAVKIAASTDGDAQIIYTQAMCKPSKL